MISFKQLLFVLLVMSFLYYSKSFQEPYRMIVGYDDHPSFRDADSYQSLDKGQKPKLV